MKLRSIFLGFLWAVVVSAYFSSQQLEIIKAHYAIQPTAKKASSQVRTFYDILQCTPKTPMDKVEKSFRKLSKKYHPDKYVKKSANERRRAERKYETFGIIMNILRDVDKKQIYDYFLAKGFPVWSEEKKMFVNPKKESIPTWVIATFSLLLITAVNYLSVWLNKKGKAKKINQVLRDVKWKAENMEKSSPKVMQVPEEAIQYNAKYSLDDKLIDYFQRPFIVTHDDDVYLLEDETVKLESDQHWARLAERVVEDGQFKLYGFSKPDLNRRERRLNAKQNKSNQTEKVEPLKWTKIEPVDPTVRLSDLIWGKLLRL